MQALTDRERAWVLAMVAFGGSPKLAAKAAGYGAIGTPEQMDAACRTAASRLTRSPKVQEAVHEEAENRLKSGALLATEALSDLVANTSSKFHFKAIQEMLARNDILNPVTRQEIKVKREVLTEPEMEQKIDLLIHRLHSMGVLPDPARGAPRIIDATFEVVETGAPTLAGLEDFF